METNHQVYEKGGIYWSLFSKKRGILMGFATFWIVAFHGTELYSDVSIPIITSILKRGNIGVEIFLIVSAIGLYFSMDQSTRIKNFYWKRIQRVLIPYLILSSWYWIWRAIVHGEYIISFFKNYFFISFITDGVTTSWYIFLILCLYFVFPLIFKVLKKEKNLIFIIIGIDCFINLMIWYFWPNVYEYMEIALTRIPTFLCGCYIAPMVKENKKIGRKTYIINICGIIIGALFIVMFSALNHKDLAIMTYRYMSFFVALLLCIIIASIAKSEHKIGIVLSGVGGASLEIYLLHIFVRNILSYYTVGENGNLLAKTLIYTIMASGVILISLLLNKLNKCNIRKVN